MTAFSKWRSLALLSIIGTCLAAEPAQPSLQLLGTAQVDQEFTAYLQEGSGPVFTLREGGTADGWRIVETSRDTHGHVVRIHLQRGTSGLWLGVAGGSPSAAATTAAVVTTATDSAPLIDTPSSRHGTMHDQLLHRSRLKNKPAARAAHRQVSDLDPFPTKLHR